ncbi:MAG: SusD/RagB family nutrient-binding outer membrane lipoprotein [Saprospiraceae bacterium]
MKFINKLFLLALIVGFVACDSELDLQNDPNAVTPDKASVNDLYNQIQLDFAGVFRTAEFKGAQLTRMDHMGSFTFEADISPNTTNGLWFLTYTDLFPDVDALLALTEERGLDIHSGSAKILKAYSLMALVDNLNNVPYSEAGQGTDIISPKADSGESVYAAAVALLDEAIAQMSGTNAAGPSNDFYYGGDGAKWITLANTLKLRAAVTTRLVDASAAGTINAIIAGGDYIDEPSEDFVAQFGDKRDNPNSRHPDYNGNYEDGGVGYLSNYYMWIMAEGYADADGNPIADPRTRYYFYRQTDDSNGQDPTVYGCHLSALPTDADARPAHYEAVDERMPYCVATANGYYGRDHGNGSGTPPDGFIATTHGLYPAGGQYDDNSFTNTSQAGTTGGKGAGFYPIMLSSYVDFMVAEAVLTAGASGDARALLESGFRKSMAKCQSMESLVSADLNRTIVVRGEEVNIRAQYVPDEEEINEFVAEVLSRYDAADATGKLNIVMTEYYKALWGNGLEAYNMYRRTGMPLNIQPTLEAAGGNFPRSLFLPAVNVNRNANATQKELSELVFWDNGSATVR